MNVHTVVCQKWEESELGWGTRPDGFSLHLSDQIRKDFIKSYWDSMPASAPDTYSRPDGSAYLVDVDDETYQKLEKNDGSFCGSGRPPGKK